MYNLNVGKIENSAKIIADAAIMHKLILIRQTAVDNKSRSGAWYSPIIFHHQQSVIYEKYHWQYPWSKGPKQSSKEIAVNCKRYSKYSLKDTSIILILAQ